MDVFSDVFSIGMDRLIERIALQCGWASSDQWKDGKGPNVWPSGLTSWQLGPQSHLPPALNRGPGSSRAPGSPAADLETCQPALPASQ